MSVNRKKNNDGRPGEMIIKEPKQLNEKIKKDKDQVSETIDFDGV